MPPVVVGVGVGVGVVVVGVGQRSVAAPRIGAPSRSPIRVPAGANYSSSSSNNNNNNNTSLRNHDIPKFRRERERKDSATEKKERAFLVGVEITSEALKERRKKVRGSDAVRSKSSIACLFHQLVLPVACR